MKTVRIIFTLILITVVPIPGTPNNSVSTKSSYDETPCDPSPTQLRWCKIKGGTFDFATCTCVIP